MSIIEIIIYILIPILIIFYIKKRKDENRKWQQTKLRLIKEEKERQKEREKSRKKLKKLKEVEDYELNAEESVLCEDGMKRKYSKSMYGIIKDKIKDCSSVKYDFKDEESKEKLIKVFGISSYDLGKSTFQSTYLTGSHNPKNMVFHKFEQRGLVYISKENWFSEKGKFLNSTEILKLRKEERDRRYRYNKKYSSLLPKTNFSKKFKFNTALDSFPRYQDTAASLFIINNVYFIETDAPIKLFQGKINGVQYVDGKDV